jgi:hypothetical protein
VRLIDDQLRVTSQFVKTGDGYPAGPDPHDFEPNYVFEVQEAISCGIAETLRGKPHKKHKAGCAGR